jgi:transposase-like protein
MGKQRTTQYSEEFRSSSAKLAVESDQPVVATARDLGVHETTLYGWIAKYYPDRNKRTNISGEIDPSEELKRLRKEVSRLRMERDILKKATAYFAGETL